jgi:ERCC4-related helicase
MKYYLEKGVVSQIKAKVNLLEEQKEPRSHVHAIEMTRSLPSIEIAMEELVEALAHNIVLQRAPPTTPKVDALIRILRNEFDTDDGGRNGIVLVQLVAFASPLAKVLNDALVSLKVRCGVVVGTSSQSEYDREAQLTRFREGKNRYLISTAALQDGIEVASCGFVIRLIFRLQAGLGGRVPSFTTLKMIPHLKAKKR